MKAKLKPLPPAPRFAPGYAPWPNAAFSDILARYIGVYVYIWLKNNRGFWMCPTEIRNATLCGYRWEKSLWVYTEIDVRQIDSLGV